MSDQISEDNSAPPRPQESGGAFDWLVESHRQSAPLAPLGDEVPRPVPPISFGFPEPQAPPAPPMAAERPTLLSQAPPPPAPSSFPLTFTETPQEEPLPEPRSAFAQQAAFPPPPVFPPPQPAFPAPQSAFPAPQPVNREAAEPVPPPAVIILPPESAPPAPIFAQPAAPAPTFAQPAPPAATFAQPVSTVASPQLGGGFGLERRQPKPRSANGPLDWIAFVLAFLAPPVGLLLGIGAVVTEPRTKGFVTGLAKAAIGIGAALSLVLGVGIAVYTKVSHDQAAHNAIVASSRGYCVSLKSNPAALSSDTFGWPAPGDTIPASITTMKQYETHWNALVKLAPAGILTGTQKVASAAKTIVAGVESTQTLDDASDVAQMQNAVATSGITDWVTSYCQ